MSNMAIQKQLIVSPVLLIALVFENSPWKGCDGSVTAKLLLQNNQAEMMEAELTAKRMFKLLTAAKTALGICMFPVLFLVCARILALIKGPFWPVPLGRRDGRVSIANEALTSLPSPFANITQLKANFASKRLNTKDLVVLSGGHTVGVSHCPVIVNRLYNFTGKGDTDPSLDLKYIPQLKCICSPTDTTTVLAMDKTPRSFDEDYYTVVLRKRGLFQSDAAFLNDKQTSAYVKLQSKSFGYTFFNDFSKSMVKMGKIGVLTGSAGEIRRTPWEKPIHKHDQEEVTRRYLLRETPQRKFSWNSIKKSLSPGCKEMLLIRMKEIEAFNASKESVGAANFLLIRCFFLE
ncbi:peroxidase 27-like protein [Tanacetum coccineum]